MEQIASIYKDSMKTTKIMLFKRLLVKSLMKKANFQIKYTNLERKTFIIRKSDIRYCTFFLDMAIWYVKHYCHLRH